MAREYEILVSINYSAPEHYETVYVSESRIEFIIARLQAYGNQDRRYTYRQA